jgi:hypothetical protein
MGAILVSLQISAQEPRKAVRPPASGGSPEIVQPVGLTNVVPTQVTREPAKNVPGSYVSPWLLDIIKLSRAGIDEGVMLTFIDSAGTFNLETEQIIYLRNAGVSTAIISAMLQHDSEVIAGLRPVPPNPSSSQPGLNLTFARSEKPVQSAQQPQPPRVETGPSSIIAETSPHSAGIVNRSDPDLFWEPPLEQGSNQEVRPAPSRTRTSPVRKPYPVTIANIVFIRGEGRPANMLVIESP